MNLTAALKHSRSFGNRVMIMSKSKLIAVYVFRITAMLFLFLTIDSSIFAVEHKSEASLIRIYIASGIIYAVSMYEAYRNKNVITPILFSIVGFWFGIHSLIMISYFSGVSIGESLEFLNIEALYKAIFGSS